MSSAKKIQDFMEQAGCQKIRPSGEGELVSSCPFHASSSFNFSMNTITGLYVCYSNKCGASGNLATFLMGALHWSVKKATIQQESLGIQFPEDDEEEAPAPPTYDERRLKGARQENVGVSERTLALYEQCPAYLLDRGFHKDVLKRWEIGLDLRTKQVTIPVRDAGGRLVGLSRRQTYEKAMPKYLHLGFRKGQYLFGGHFRADTVEVGEGQLDAIALNQLLGVPAVSTMGARVSKRQANLLAGSYDSVVLAFDDDSDGRSATRRVGDQLLNIMGPACVRVRSFVGLKDPGDLLGTSEAVRKAWRAEAPVYYDRWRLQHPAEKEC